MFKYSKLDYDEFYSSQHCKDENAEIKAILDSVCGDKDTVLDLGAGTGLVASMLGDRCLVVQIEKDPGMKEQNPYPNFTVTDAYDFVAYWAKNAKAQFDHVVSVFALNYMKHGTMTLACEAAKKECVFVVYDRPYEKGSNSFYAGHKLCFLLKHFLKMQLIEREIGQLQRNGFVVNCWNLLGEPYYRVIKIGRADH